MSAVSERSGAPIGSLYHRYPSRELLLADVWLSLVEEFQQRFLETLGRADPVEAGISAIRFIGEWIARFPSEAQLLLTHRSEDFASNRWPPSVQERAAWLRRDLDQGMKDFARRCFGIDSSENVLKAWFALIDVPHGAVRRYVAARQPAPAEVLRLIEDAARQILGCLPSERKGEER
jgi:AcrR family transcriptional regulator